MNNLQEKVQAMLAGETKRRATALRWITEVIEAILPAAETLWGSGERDWTCTGNGTISITKTTAGIGNLYFRFIQSESTANGEAEGVGCFIDQTGNRVWGTAISELKGSDFWWAVRSIMEWVPVVTQMLAEKGLSRDKLIEKMNI